MTSLLNCLIMMALLLPGIIEGRSILRLWKIYQRSLGDPTTSAATTTRMTTTLSPTTVSTETTPLHTTTAATQMTSNTPTTAQTPSRSSEGQTTTSIVGDTATTLQAIVETHSSTKFTVTTPESSHSSTNYDGQSSTNIPTTASTAGSPAPTASSPAPTASSPAPSSSSPASTASSSAPTASSSTPMVPSNLPNVDMGMFSGEVTSDWRDLLHHPCISDSCVARGRECLSCINTYLSCTNCGSHGSCYVVLCYLECDYMSCLFPLRSKLCLNPPPPF